MSTTVCGCNVATIELRYDGMPKAKPLKDEVVRMRVTPEQKRILTEAAEREALDLSAWLRQIALRAAGALKG